LLERVGRRGGLATSAPSSPVMTNTSMSPLLLMISSTSDGAMRLRQPLRLGLPQMILLTFRRRANASSSAATLSPLMFAVSAPRLPASFSVCSTRSRASFERRTSPGVST